MELHYVCTGGCGGLSETPGACGDENCLMYNMDLTPCDCEDNSHDKVIKASPADLSENADNWEFDDDIDVDEEEVATWQGKMGGEEKSYN